MILDSLATTGDTARSRFHRLGVVLRCVLLLLTLGLLAMVVAPGAAEAHGLHAEQSAPDLADHVTAYEKNLGVAAQCETTCCSPLICASALVSLHDSSPQFDAEGERFLVPTDARAAGFLQTALRRPPRA